LAASVAGQDAPDASAVAPQWHVIERISVAAIYHAEGDLNAVETTLSQAIGAAELLRLPHQIQRAMRLACQASPDLSGEGRAALMRLQLTLPAA
jgi:hypothetical protein